MLCFTRDDLKRTAERLLSMNPEPVPKFRLLRDVLELDPDAREYRDAKTDLDTSSWVRKLEESQLDDGTWGRFHTQDTKVKQAFPTTESAIRVALDSGLEADHRIFRRLMPTLLDYMRGKYIWRDWPEKHDNPAAWSIWVRHYSAAALASIDPLHPELYEFHLIRAKSLEEAFASGGFDRDIEIDALCRLLDCRMKNPVPFHVQPALLVITATRNQLPEKIERGVIEYLLERDNGIGYVYEGSLSMIPKITERQFFSWINGLSLISRFRLWPEYSEVPLNAIWSMRNEDGLWAAGNIARKPFSCFPLSDSWRKPKNRIIDSSVVLLSLLATAV